MAPAQALALEAGPLVQRDRCLVVRPHLQLDLVRAVLAAPGDHFVDQRMPDPAASRRGIDVHAQRRDPGQGETREDRPDDGLTVELTTELVSVPYVALTIAVMDRFGASVEHDDGWRTLRVAASGYRSIERFEVEPDATAASYWAAAAVIVGGSVRIEGLGRSSVQGDVAFLDDRLRAHVAEQRDLLRHVLV